MKTPNTQLFSNSLTNEEVNAFTSAIYASDVYSYLVNPRYVDSSVTLDQLATMKSIRPQDGELH